LETSSRLPTGNTNRGTAAQETTSKGGDLGYIKYQGGCIPRSEEDRRGGKLKISSQKKSVPVENQEHPVHRLLEIARSVPWGGKKDTKIHLDSGLSSEWPEKTSQQCDGLPRSQESPATRNTTREERAGGSEG